MKRSMVSGTGSKSKRTISLRVTLFLVIVCVALVCVAASALLSSYLANHQIGEFVEQHQDELQPPPGTTNPGQPPGANPPPMPPPRPSNINLSFLLAGALGLFLALLLSFLLAGRISRPLSSLTSATKKVAGGDYTERVPVSGGKEVEELGDAFNTLTESLENNEELRKNMVADIAHELRNPLATLRGQLELLQDGRIEYDREIADSLMEDALMLSHIVEDLRQLSLVDAGQLEFEFQAVEVRGLLRDAFSRFEHEASNKGVKLEIVPGPDLPPAKADPVRLAQILGNLVGNSVAHTEAGGTIKLSAERSGEDIVFTVADTGTGISPEELPHIFDRFYRTDKSRARATGGAGLGLSIAKSLIEAHAGTVAAESEGERGTSIRFTIPLFQA